MKLSDHHSVIMTHQVVEHTVFLIRHQMGLHFTEIKCVLI